MSILGFQQNSYSQEIFPTYMILRVNDPSLPPTFEPIYLATWQQTTEDQPYISPGVGLYINLPPTQATCCPVHEQPPLQPVPEPAYAGALVIAFVCFIVRHMILNGGRKVRL